MDKDRVEGKAKESAGSGKDKTGNVTGDEKLKARGKTERVEGKGQGALGKVKDAVKDAVKR